MVNVMTALMAGIGLQVTALVTVSSFHTYTIFFMKEKILLPEEKKILGGILFPWRKETFPHTAAKPKMSTLLMNPFYSYFFVISSHNCKPKIVTLL